MNLDQPQCGFIHRLLNPRAAVACGGVHLTASLLYLFEGRVGIAPAPILISSPATRTSDSSWDQCRNRLSALKPPGAASTSFGGIFDIESRGGRIAVLEEEMAAQGFWDDRDEARRRIAEANTLNEWVRPWRALDLKAGELGELAELLADEDDPDLQAEWEEEIGALEEAIGRLELSTMLGGEDDHREAMLTIHPRAGGLESQDWAEMLSRMYMRWAERRGYELKVLDLHSAEEAGIKSVTVEIRGDYAYGYLKAEKGVHRLVRISPFDSQARRHTSFASVFVYPVLDDEIEIEIDESELRVDTFRASGAGGQHVNKTDSAIRITHLPTRIAVSCQQERSQHKNRSTAMKMLKAALYQRAREEKEKEKQALESSKTEIAWGNQIRSYVFAPYTMVNDHRTEVKKGDVNAVMDGALEPFIEAYLKRFGRADAR